MKMRACDLCERVIKNGVLTYGIVIGPGEGQELDKYTATDRTWLFTGEDVCRDCTDRVWKYIRDVRLSGRSSIARAGTE